MKVKDFSEKGLPPPTLGAIAGQPTLGEFAGEFDLEVGEAFGPQPPAKSDNRPNAGSAAFSKLRDRG